MKGLLTFFCCLLVTCCALISFAGDFENIPDITVAEAKKMPDNKLIFLSGKIKNNIFSDETGAIRITDPKSLPSQEKTHILARTHNSWFNHEISIISPSCQ